MNKRSLSIAGAFAGFCLLVLAGCSYFGGDEPDYTYWEPILSPDGNMIAYESTTESSLELFVLDLATNSERQLTDNEHANWSPTWSPDGSQIAFASSRDENVDIYVLNVATLEASRLTTHSAADINPSWGSDGAIYFNSNRTETWEAYTIDPESLVLRKLTSLGTSTP
ncbi:TolB family protein [Candidatus Bipolaricaulota bacterium]